MDVIYLWLEYSLIPVSLIGFNKIFQSFSGDHNISKKNVEHKNLGIEIMLVLTISCFLYALSIFAHSGEDPHTGSDKKDCIIWALFTGIIELVGLLFITWKVSIWGKINVKSKKWPNRIAVVYSIVLMILIFFSQSHLKHENIFELINSFFSSFTDAVFKSGKLKIIAAIILLLVLVFITLYLFKKIKSNKDETLWNKILLLKDNSPLKIEKLRHLIKTSFSDSNYLFYAYEKLIALYNKSGNYQEALSTLNDFESTDVYNSADKSGYVIQSILNLKCVVLINFAKQTKDPEYLKQAENVVEIINNLPTKIKLQAMIADAKKAMEQQNG